MLTKRNWAIAAMAGVCVPASTVLAAEAGHAAEEPSLFAGDLGNAIFTLLIFVLVLVVLARFAWGPLLSALQKREKYIHDSLASAKRDREASEQRLREIEARLAKAHEEASAIVDEGRRDAEVVKRRIEEEARKSADDLVSRAKREIGIARDSALKDLYEQSAQLAMTMAGSVLRRQVTPEDQQRLISEALSEMRAQGNGKGSREAEAASR
jgi:F-type H+-transporting ATPase subunit b